MWNGGLKKSVSRLALVAAAGVISTSAMAADLGGDCCADLEERVAELEATTARKGTRKVSLTISGQVNKMIMHYNDHGIGSATDRSSNTYWGIDNTNSSTRFNFTGSAKVSPTVNAGFNMTIEVNTGARSASVNQSRAEVGGVFTNSPANSTYGRDDHALGMRDAVVWIESTQIGRLSLGRLTQTGPQGTIDLGGIGVIAPGTILVGNALAYRDAAGALTPATLGNFFDNAADTNKRIDGVRYDSPSLAGFQIGASYGEASNTLTYGATTPGPVGDVGNAYAVNLRYAGEFSGVRLAAAVGYERLQEDGFVSPAGTDKRHIGGSLSLMHVPTGLFVQGGYTQISTTNEGEARRTGSVWHVAGGISQNWFGIGKTSLYGEYGRGDDMGFVHRVAGIAAAGDSSRFWGLGMVQNIDAAAMELYLGYRNHMATDNAGFDSRKVDIIAGGARIKF